MPAAQQVETRERLVRRVRREELAYLLDARSAPHAQHPPDELHVGQVAGGQLVVAALPVKNL